MYHQEIPHTVSPGKQSTLSGSLREHERLNPGRRPWCMDYLTILRNTKGFNEGKTVTRLRWSLWTIEPQFKVGGKCSDAGGRPIEDFIEETT